MNANKRWTLVLPLFMAWKRGELTHDELRLALAILDGAE